MERYEVPVDARLADLVERAARGDEVVIVRDGREIATLKPTDPEPADPAPLDLQALMDLRAKLPLWKDDPAALIREMRDSDRF